MFFIIVTKLSQNKIIASSYFHNSLFLFSKMPYYLKIINIFLLATVKYFYTPLAAFLLNLTLTETIVTMLSGGIFSFIFFYYLTNILLTTARYCKPALLKITPKKWISWYEKRKEKNAIKRQHRKKFTRRNKLIIKIRKTYGFWGIVISTPIALSIPLGAFLMHKYYRKRKGAVAYSIGAIVIEGIILCFLYYLIPGLRS